MRGAAPRAAHFLLRGQEKVSKEKAARDSPLCGTLRFSPFQSFGQLARQEAASLKQPSLDPEMPAMLGIV